MEYGAPDIRVTIAGWTTARVASCVLTTDRSAPIGRAEISLDLEDLPTPSPAAGDAITVDLGFRGGDLVRAWEGRVRQTEPGRLFRIVGQDGIRDLADVVLTQAYRNVSLQDVARFLLERAGVSRFVLGTAKTDRQHLFVARGQGVLALLEEARRSWGVDWDLFTRARTGEVVFAPWAETAEALADSAAELEYGRNLVDLVARPEGTGTAETWAMPWLRAGHRVHITDARLWKAAEAVRCERVTHELMPRKGGKTRIEWTRLAS